MTHRLSTIGLAFVAVLSLAACTPSTNPDDQSGSSSTGGRPLAKEGEFCAGIAAFQCDTGLTCTYDGNHPDAGGTCVRD